MAAGHPATARAGLEALEAGGNAVDAAVCACFASCVSEVVMTGLLGGGQAMVWEASGKDPPGRAHQLDFFTNVPGLGAAPTRTPPLMAVVDVPFGEETIRYEIGPQSCAVPGIPSGLFELWRRFGRLEWERLLEPAIRLSREGVPMPPAHAACLRMLAPVLTIGHGEKLFSPRGSLLEEGDPLAQPGLAAALELIAADPHSLYGGTLADSLLELIGERGGLVTSSDLASYRPLWHEPVEVAYSGTRFFTRGGITGVPEALSKLAPLGGLSERERLHELIAVLAPGGIESHTTNLVTADGDGNACVITTSLGLGSGDYLPGFDLHLNSMLGETALIGPAGFVPGERMQSMMSPSVAADERGLALAIGAAGGTRLRTALVGVAASILDEGLGEQEAIDRPRFHPAGRALNAEPGVSEEALADLEAEGWDVRRWDSLHHYFGGVSAIGRTGAAGDPRRSGSGLIADR